MGTWPSWQSFAGHHNECPHPFDKCLCMQLFDRDRLEAEERAEVPLYSEDGWPYDDRD